MKSDLTRASTDTRENGDKTDGADQDEVIAALRERIAELEALHLKPVMTRSVSEGSASHGRVDLGRGEEGGPRRLDLDVRGRQRRRGAALRARGGGHGCCEKPELRTRPT